MSKKDSESGKEKQPRKPSTELRQKAPGLPKAEEDRDIYSEHDEEETFSHEAEFEVRINTTDPEHPYNWSRRRRWMITLVVASVTFLSPLVSSILAPTSYIIADEFGIKSSVGTQMIMTMYVLAYAVGPLIFSPISEMTGRKRIFVACNFAFLVFNLGCGWSKTTAQMYVLRFFTGLGGSAPLSVSGAILGDIWPKEERALAMGIYSLCPLIGPSLGPLIGGFIGEYGSWRWSCWATSIADAFALAALLFLYPETYIPQLVRQKTRMLIKKTGDRRYWNEYSLDEMPVAAKLKLNMIRPFKLLFTQVIIAVMSSFLAYFYGLNYLILTSFAKVWVDYYHERLDIAGLNYISVALGMTVGSQLGTRLMSYVFLKLKKRNGGVSIPEHRLPLLILCGPLLTIGLLIYGWTADKRVFWLVPNIGMFIVSGATILCMFSCQLYIVDAYGIYSASALAAASSARSLCGFAFPLFGPYMFDAVGVGWGNTILAFAGLLVLPASVAIFKYGETLRKMSPYCSAK